MEKPLLFGGVVLFAAWFVMALWWHARLRAVAHRVTRAPRPRGREPTVPLAVAGVVGASAAIAGWQWLQGRGWPNVQPGSWFASWRAVAEAVDGFLFGPFPRPDQTLAGLLALAFGLALLTWAASLGLQGDGLRVGRGAARSPRLWFAIGAAAWLMALVLAPWPLPGLQAGLWLTALFAVGYGLFLRHGHCRWSGLTRADGRYIAFWLGVGLFVGLYRLQGFPAHLLGDEGAFWDYAVSLVREDHRPRLFDLGVYSFPALSSYVQAAVLKAFGPSFWAWRWSSVLTWLAAVPFLYALLAEFTPSSRRLAHLGVIAYLFAPYGLAVSRYGYNNVQALPVVTAALAVAYGAYAYRNRTAWYVAGVLAGLGFYTYPAAHSALLIIVAFVLTLRGPFPRRQALVALGLGWALVVVPGAWNVGLRYGHAALYKYAESFVFNGFYARALFGDAFVEQHGWRWVVPAAHQELYWHSARSPWLLLRGVLRTVLALVQADVTVQRFITFPLLGRWGAPWALLGLVLWPWMRWRAAARRLVAWWLLVPMVFFSVLNTFPPRALHMVALIPALAVLVASGLDAAADVVGRVVAHTTVAMCARGVVVGLGVFALVYGGWQDYFGQPSDLFPRHDVDVITWAMLEAQDEPFYFVYNKNARPEDTLPQPYGPRFRPDLRYTVYPTTAPVDLRAFPPNAVLLAYAHDRVLPEGCIVHTFDTPQGPLAMCGPPALAARLTAPSLWHVLLASYGRHPQRWLALVGLALLWWGRRTLGEPLAAWLSACWRLLCADAEPTAAESA